MYAIIATGGKQYKVAEGDVLKVEKLGAAAGETVTFDQVIAVSNDGLKVGADVAGATVTATVVGEGKGKVIVYKYKEKDRLPQEEWSQTSIHSGENRENQRLIIRFCDGMFYDDDSNSKDKGFLSGV